MQAVARCLLVTGLNSGGPSLLRPLRETVLPRHQVFWKLLQGLLAYRGCSWHAGISDVSASEWVRIPGWVRSISQLELCLYRGAFVYLPLNCHDGIVHNVMSDRALERLWNWHRFQSYCRCTRHTHNISSPLVGHAIRPLNRIPAPRIV